ncbi:DUF6185 family protein [Streptomyces sp. NPDC047971]|uniref:DUF6185 family protein n=1 Tax=Streptomyces sp. NPDC047971 TaxID=3154499 RepID=UPI0033C7D26F
MICLLAAVVVLTLSVLTCGLVSSGTAYAAEEPPDNVCVKRTLRGAEVDASLRIAHDGQYSTKVTSDLVIKVPRAWMWSSALLLNRDTEDYRTAMRCLLRSSEAPTQYRDTEWQYKQPRVRADKTWVTVEQQTVTWVYAKGDRDVGPWHMVSGSRTWHLELLSPDALSRSVWSRVRIDLGGRPARSVVPAPTTGSSTVLTWNGTATTPGPPSGLHLELQPPATKANAARWATYPWNRADVLGWLSWDVAVLVTTLVLLRKLRHRPPLALPTPEEEAARRNLRTVTWTWFTITMVHASDDHLLNFLEELPDGTPYTDHRQAVHLIVTALLGVALCVLGRPGRAALAAVTAALGYVGTLALAPSLFGLPPTMALYWGRYPEEVAAYDSAGGIYWFALGCAALVFIWLVGLVSGCLRLWRDASPGGPGGTFLGGRFSPVVLVGTALVSCAVAAGSLWAAAYWWDRVSWLTDRGTGTDYALFRAATVFNDQRWFASNVADWAAGFASWWMASVALLALARARQGAPGHTGEVLRRHDPLLLKLFFVMAVAPAVGQYGGVPLPLLSLVVVWCLLSALLALGRRHSVLGRLLTPAVPLHRVVGEHHRIRMMAMARQHRELHAELRRLEQGQTEGARAPLERKLDRLHRWTPLHPRHRHHRVRLPHEVGPVELALAWGPRAGWWDNACRAAVIASLVGLPATGVLFWADQVRGTLWADSFSYQFGFASMLTYLVSSVVIWAGAGFTLGALWRILPMRRGPGRGFTLAIVYSLPLLVDLLGNVVVGQPIGTAALNAALMTLVLTLTGMLMDIDTFRQERHYWPTRTGLLLSLYQMRTASAQVALLVAQVVALVTIWQQLSGNPPVVLIDHQGPIGTSAPGGSSGH